MREIPPYYTRRVTRFRICSPNNAKESWHAPADYRHQTTHGFKSRTKQELQVDIHVFHRTQRGVLLRSLKPKKKSPLSSKPPHKATWNLQSAMPLLAPPSCSRKPLSRLWVIRLLRARPQRKQQELPPSFPPPHPPSLNPVSHKSRTPSDKIPQSTNLQEEQHHSEPTSKTGAGAGAGRSPKTLPARPGRLRNSRGTQHRQNLRQRTTTKA